jgi:hypothetical protein
LLVKTLIVRKYSENIQGGQGCPPHKTQNTKHKTQNTKHKTQNTKHKTQNTKHKTQNTKHKTQNKHKSAINFWKPFT